MKFSVLYPILVGVVLAILLSACTDNTSTRRFGGSSEVSIPCDHKLMNVTWKQNDMWLHIRPMVQGDVPQKTFFIEKSMWGILEGKVEINERKC